MLEIIRKLGYRKTQPSELKLGDRAIDWTERADAPAGVSKPADSAEGNEPRAAKLAARVVWSLCPRTYFLLL